MEIIDFLKYGAIGISLALALLSYRLLSKEQDKEEVRVPMLNSIRNYFFLAVGLSVFFGLAELAGRLLMPAKDNTQSGIEKLWNSHFSSFQDSTFTQKLNRISAGLSAPKPPVTQIDTTQICQSFSKELAACKSELESFNNGFYQNIIKLKGALKKDPDGWIRISHQTSAKGEVVKTLKRIFNSLGDNSDNLEDKEIVAKWKSLKRAWASEQLDYIFDSDVTQIVQKFLNKFSALPNKQ